MSKTPQNLSSPIDPKHYGYKLLTNFIGLLTSLISQAIVPRALGPVAYGSFNFLTTFFLQGLSFADVGSADYFFTRVSSQKYSGKFLGFYICFFISLLFVLFGFVFLVSSLGFLPFVWPEQTLTFILFATGYAGFTWFMQRVTQTMDATGETVAVEQWRIRQRFFSAIIIVLLFAIGALNAKTFYLHHFVIMFFLTAGCTYHLKSTSLKNIPVTLPNLKESKQLTKEILVFTSPLLLANLIGTLAAISDKWLLQKYSGGLEQGYFGLSQNLGNLCFVFTSAMTPLVWREYSRAYAENDTEKAREIFSGYVPVFFTLTAIVSAFVAMNAMEFILLFGGKEYANAHWAVLLMAFYPVHQTYGQLLGTFFLATHRTKTYGMISLSFNLLGTIAVFLLFAVLPKLFGFAPNSIHLAAKVVLLQLIIVNVLLYFICKYLSVAMRPLVIHQILCLTIFVLFASALHLIGVSTDFKTSLFFLGIRGVLYLVGVSILLYSFSNVFRIPPSFINFINHGFQRLKTRTA